MPIIILLILIIVVLAAWLGLGYLGFKTAICRGHELDINDRESYKGTSWDKYYDGIMEGIEWINSHERKPVTILSDDGLKLQGRLTRHPDAKGIVLMFHGYRTHPEIDFSASSHVYYEAGNHIVHIDQRASGDSEGKYIGFGVPESKDCRKWCEWAAAEFGRDFPIMIAGLSMGASTVLMAAGEQLPPGVCRIVADSAFSSPAEIIRQTIHNRYKINGKILTVAIGIWTSMLAHYSIKGCSIPQIMENNEIPVFFIHGMKDPLVPVSMTQRAIDACKGPKVVLLAAEAVHGTAYLVEYEKYRDMLFEFCKMYQPLKL